MRTMQPLSTSITLSDFTFSDTSPYFKASKLSAGEEEGDVIFYTYPFEYKRTTAQEVMFHYSLRPTPANPLFISDYFQNKKLLYIMNKYKRLSYKPDSLRRKPLRNIPVFLEVDFYRIQKRSYVAMYLTDPVKRLKRCRSLPSLHQTQKKSTVIKKGAMGEISLLNGGSSQEGSSNFKTPQRHVTTAKNDYKESEIELPSLMEVSNSPTTLRKTMIFSQSMVEFAGNFLKLERLLDFIFLKENESDLMELDTKLVDKLKRVLLICYGLFMSQEELIGEIIKRFWVLESNKNKASISEEVLDQFSIASYQIDLLGFLKTWIKEKPEDFYKKEEVLKPINELLISISLKLETRLRPQARSLQTLLEKLKSLSTQSIQPANLVKRFNNIFPRVETSRKTKTYFGQIHKEVKFVNLHNIHEIFMVLPPFEIAKQFCLFDLGLVSQIRLQHIRESQKHKSLTHNPYLRSAVHFNHFVLFIIFLITQVERKAVLISRLVTVANSLFELRDYQGFAILMTALTHTFIFESVNKILQESDREVYSLKHDLEALLDKKNGYRSLKRVINQANFPMVPFVPLTVQDIFRIDGYHQSHQRDSDGGGIKVNLDKMEMIFETFENIYLTQFSSYDFESMRLFQEFLETFYKEVLYGFAGTRNTGDIEDILHHIIIKPELSK